MIDARRLEEALVRSMRSLPHAEVRTVGSTGDRVAVVYDRASVRESGKFGEVEINLSRIAEIMESELS
jgi:hypothetical protein